MSMEPDVALTTGRSSLAFDAIAHKSGGTAAASSKRFALRLLHPFPSLGVFIFTLHPSLFTLRSPGETVRSGRDVLQSRVEVEGKRYLVRVFVDGHRSPPEVVTVYRTSKIEKYWGSHDGLLHALCGRPLRAAVDSS